MFFCHDSLHSLIISKLLNKYNLNYFKNDKQLTCMIINMELLKTVSIFS